MTQQALYEFSNTPHSLEIDYAVRNHALQDLAKVEMQDLLHARAIARINNVKNEPEVAHSISAKEQKTLSTNLFDAEAIELTATTTNPALQELLQKEMSELLSHEHVSQPNKNYTQATDVAMNDIVPFLARLQQERASSRDKGFSIS